MILRTGSGSPSTAARCSAGPPDSDADEAAGTDVGSSATTAAVGEGHVGPPDFDEATTTRSANHAQSFAEAMVTRAEAPQRVRLGRASGQCVRRGIGAPSVEASVGKPPLGTMSEAALQMG